jgi:hypothetical protein
VTVARFLNVVSSMTAHALAYVRSLLPQDGPPPANPRPPDSGQEAPPKQAAPPASQPARRDRTAPGAGAGSNPAGPSSPPGAAATPSYQAGAALAKTGLGAGALFGGDTRSRRARRRGRRPRRSFKSPTAAGDNP